MNFYDIFKSSFLRTYSSEFNDFDVFALLFITMLLGIYIFFFYRFKTRNVFYSNEFSISLTAVTIITAGIIITIQQSIVVSLGMVGALSIVRFRTAIKNPMDLTFMFWAISIGIMCGARVIEVALFLTITITIVLVVLDYVPNMCQSKILQISYKNDVDIENKISEIICINSRRYNEKSRNNNLDQVDVIYELRVKDGIGLTRMITEVEGVYGCTLFSNEK